MKLRFFIFSVVASITFVNAQEKIQLDQVIALALEKNYDILLAKNSSSTNLTNNNYAWAAFLPQVSATGAAMWNSNQQTLLFKDASKNVTGPNQSDNLTASAQLIWTLFDGTKMFATKARVAMLAEQGTLAVKDQIVNTIAAIITNYYSIVRQKQQLNAIQEQMAVSDVRVKLADKKLQVGTGSKPELLQARVDFNTQRTQVLQQEAAIVQLKQQLNILSGLQLPDEFDVSDSIEINLSLSREEVLKDVNNSNYSLRAARRNFDITHLQLQERRAELLPTLNFNAAYNYNRTQNTKLTNPYASIFSKANGLNYGFTVAIPILNGFTARRQIELAKIVADRQQVLYSQLEANVNTSLRNAFTNYDNARKVLVIEEETILLAKENVFIALESFKRGVSTFIELRTAQQSLAEAYNRLIAARYDAKVAETELMRLSGALLK